jgi:transcriptional regulator with XRE-family HTH domain
MSADQPHIHLAEWRDRAGLKQHHVAALFGFESTAAVSKWETGRVSPQLSDLAALAQLYGVAHPADLLRAPSTVESSAELAEARRILAIMEPAMRRNWLEGGAMMARAARELAHQSPHLLRAPAAAPRRGRPLGSTGKRGPHGFHEPPRSV